MENNSLKLFWSGGWDSTFRLLQLLIIEHKIVQPLYVVDHMRVSMPKELETMVQLKLAIKTDFPLEYERLLPTSIHHRLNINGYPDISQNFNIIAKSFPTGGQEEWLRCFIEDKQLDAVELCLEKSLPATGRLLQAILDDSSGIGHDCKLNSDLKNKDLEFFRCYRFPIAHLSRIDMRTTAIKHKFIDILEKTWFCHFPKLNSIPCGFCSPCQEVIKCGMGYRVPTLMRLRFKMHKFRKALNS